MSRAFEIRGHEDGKLLTKMIVDQDGKSQRRKVTRTEGHEGEGHEDGRLYQGKKPSHGEQIKRLCPRSSNESDHPGDAFVVIP